MKFLVISLFAAFSAAPTWAADSLAAQALATEHRHQANSRLTISMCQGLTAQNVQANYLVSKADTDEAQSKKSWSYSALNLIRKGENKVAYQYPSLKINDVWTKQKNQKVSLLKAFDAYQQAINYDAIEVSDLIAERWNKLYHLINPKLLSQLKQGLSQGEGCLQSINYSGQLNGELIQITWLTQLKIPQSINWSSKKQFKQYKLKTLKPSSAHYFQQIEDYQSTDFADIGDNEADPFLQKMINLGFVHHSHESVYDAQGHKKH